MFVINIIGSRSFLINSKIEKKPQVSILLKTYEDTVGNKESFRLDLHTQLNQLKFAELNAIWVTIHSGTQP